MERPQLLNKIMDAEFEQNGYIILKQFIQPEEIQILRELYKRTRNEKTLDDPNNPLLKSSKAAGFYANITVADSSHRKEVNAGIRKIVDAKLTTLLRGYKSVFANFIVKEPIPQSAVAPHLDWHIVDESRFSAIRFWVPLQDVNQENSTIGLIAGSHRKINILRGTPHYPYPYKDQIEKLYKMAIYPDLNAGDGVLFFNQLLHCSLPNQSSEARIAFDYQLAPENARLYQFYFPPESLVELDEPKILHVERWEVSPEFFLTFQIQQPYSGPHCRKVADIQYHWRKFTDEELGL